MPISDELKRIYTSAPTDDNYIETMELSHTLLTTQYLTNRFGGWTGDLETGGTANYIYLPFAVIPPRASEDAALSLSVAIDNVSRELMDELETLSTNPTDPITMIYRVYLESDTAVQNDPPLTLDITSVQVNNYTVSFSAGTTNLRNLPFPRELYTTKRFPGLLR